MLYNVTDVFYGTVISGIFSKDFHIIVCFPISVNCYLIVIYAGISQFFHSFAI